MKIVIAINNLTVLDQLAYSNHLQFFYRLGKHFPKDTFILVNPRRMSIDRTRNEAAKIALNQEADYLMFIDDDVLLPPDAFDLLLKADKDVVAGITMIRGYPFHPMVFDFKNEVNGHYADNYKELADKETNLYKCDAVGFSCCLIKTSLLKKVRPPFFITSTHQTEDVYFCIRAKEYVPELEIYAHAGVETGHILGSDIITPTSVEAWKTLEETRFPGLKERAEEESKAKGKVDHARSDLEESMKIPV